MTDDGQPHKPDDDMPTYTCPRCGRVSYNPNDVRERYCSACRRFEDQLELGSESF